MRPHEIIFVVGLLLDLVLILLPSYSRDDPSRPQIFFLSFLFCIGFYSALIAELQNHRVSYLHCVWEPGFKHVGGNSYKRA